MTTRDPHYDAGWRNNGGPWTFLKTAFTAYFLQNISLWAIQL